MASAVTTAPATPTTPTSTNADIATHDKDASVTHVRAPSIPSVLALKDRRAFEHERQRARKAGDRKTQVYRYERYNYHGHGLSLAKQKQMRPDELDRLEGVVEPGDVNGHWDDEFFVPPKGLSSQVYLGDLLDAKTKVRSVRRQDSDFEVVPSVRSVIVLDDFIPDVSADEPWEHLSDSESDSASSTSTSPPTYAQVLSSDS
ncbi:hypothetical protein BDZ89DRAFT_1075752 [Hymenopellis radicata]|nr:hypothetical protein BDZ89DRAFT_1075752 [Hymenopellis radicata]